MLKLVIFDLFDTLVYIETFDRETSLKKAHKVLIDGGYRIPYNVFQEKYIEKMEAYFEWRKKTAIERTNADIIQEIFKEMGISVAYQVAEKAVNAYFEGFTIKFFPQVKAVLEDFSKDFDLRLLSNLSWPPLGYKIIKPIKSYFTKIIFSAELGKRKPDEFVFRKILGNYKAQEAVFCGDELEDDVYGALKIGMWAIWVNTRNVKEESPKNSHFIGEIKEIGEIISLKDTLLQL